MVSFVAIYRGKTPQSAELVAVSSDRHLTSLVSEQMLAVDAAPSAPRDAVVSSIRKGRRQALELLVKESSGG